MLYLRYGASYLCRSLRFDIKPDSLDQPLDLLLKTDNSVQYTLKALCSPSSLMWLDPIEYQTFRSWLLRELNQDPIFEELAPKTQNGLVKTAYPDGRLFIYSIMTLIGEILDQKTPLRDCLNKATTTEFGKAFCLKLKTKCISV